MNDWPLITFAVLISVGVIVHIAVFIRTCWK